MDDHSSGTSVAGRLTRPTRTATRKRVTCHPYLVLLPVGLAVPFPLPGPRCALTAPFQPHLHAPEGPRIGGIFSVALSLGLPPADVIRHRVSVEPGLSSRQRALPKSKLSRSHTDKRPSSHLTQDDYRWRLCSEPNGFFASLLKAGNQAASFSATTA